MRSAGPRKQKYGIELTSFGELRPGTMTTTNGQGMTPMGYRFILLPVVPAVLRTLFARTKDKDIALAMVRPTTTGTSTSGAAAAQAARPVHNGSDLGSTVDGRGVRRAAQKGPHALTFSENRPSWAGLQFIRITGTRCGRRAARRRGDVRAIGSSSQSTITSPDAPHDVIITLPPMNIVQAPQNWIWSRVFGKFPDLEVALSEGGIGWIPYFLERMTTTMIAILRGPARISVRPCQVRCSTTVITCFIDDSSECKQEV